jgi:DNA primase
MPTTALAATEPPDPQRIVEVVGRYTALRPLGGTQLQGSCPFCGSTAFRVRPDFGTFHCWRCGHGGDATMFTTKIDNHA